jgi:nitrogen-specific signal transduction histidine kinase
MSSAGETVLTHFAPAGRETAATLRHQQDVVRSTPLLRETMDALPDVVLMLNGRRQVVGGNKALYELLRCAPADVLGKRAGELLGCRNVAMGPDGCGTANNCASCGAIDAMLECQRTGQRVTRECRLLFADPVGALDLQVSVTAVEVGGERLLICVFKDISDQKRLALLGHLFFHDVVNTVGTIQGFARLLLKTTPPDSPQSRDLAQLAELADQLVAEIRAQRDLTHAESGDLRPDFEPLNTRDLLDGLVAAYRRHRVALGREIRLAHVWNGNIITDHRLLSRVLGNMIKNALEATEHGGTVTVDCRAQQSRVAFGVHNAAVMPPDVQRQVFQRSFSTKAEAGRGIGTHSMKLFGERYLGGSVGFTSREPEGTTFTITLPKVTLGSPRPRTAK